MTPEQAEQAEQAEQQSQSQNDSATADAAGDTDRQTTNQTDPQTAQTTRRELVIVDTSVEDYQQLVDDLMNNSDTDRELEIFTIDADENGIERLTEILAGRQDLDALHIISHGQDGSFRLGNEQVNSQSLTANAGQIAGWGDALRDTGDILLYGCDVAGTSDGREFVDSLAALTDQQVAASDDDTGASHRGGDYEFEYHSGEIETRNALSESARQSYDHVLAAGPSVDFAQSAIESPLGENVNFDLVFNNTGSDVGYGPFIDLVFPTNGADGAAGTDIADGLTFAGATYLNQPINATELTFVDDGNGNGVVEHPYLVDNNGDPQVISGTIGDTLVVLELPFGSFAPGQPEAIISVSATMSSLADLGTAMVVQTRSGFRFGEDPLDNPSSDPQIVDDPNNNVTDPSSGATSWSEQLSVTPTLLSLRKTYLGPESETATGPNHVQQYQIAVDIPDGQTIADLLIADNLPNNMVVTSIDSVTVGGTATTAYTDNFASLTGPGFNESLEIRLDDPVTGQTTSSDVVVTFSFYIDEFEATSASTTDRVIPVDGEDDHTGGGGTNDSRSFNNASATGTWMPDDNRDTGGVVSADPAGFEHELDNKSIAIQKSVSVVGGGTQASPGDQLQYTLTFQISDYYTFGDLIIDDIFQDGQRFDFDENVTFTIGDAVGTVAGVFTVEGRNSPEGTVRNNPGATLIVDEGRIDFSDNTDVNGNDIESGQNPPGATTSNGETVLRFDVSQAMRDADNAEDGILQGGRSRDTDGGGATGTITFYTIVQEEFADDFQSGDRSVDQGDLLTNDELTITGSVRQNEESGGDITAFENGATAKTESDNSSAAIGVKEGSLTKSIFAINGDTNLPTDANGNVTLAAGDVVTYRLIYTLPTTDFENLSLSDFLPLPIFDVADHDADGTDNPDSTPGTAPNDYGFRFDSDAAFDPNSTTNSGLIQYGSNRSFTAIRGTADDSPTIEIDVASNSLTLDFGTFDDPNSDPSTIDLLISVTATDTPTADGLFLTNIARATEGRTNRDATSSDQIAQIKVTQPVLEITKGVVATDNPDATLDGTVPAGVTLTAIGTPGNPFNGTINSTNLPGTFDGNVTGIDRGDTIRYAIVIENIGTGTRGAFDVNIADALPPGMNFVSGSVQVVDNTGNAIAIDNANADDLFTTGITLSDPDADNGALGEFDQTNGDNIAIVFYDVIVDGPASATANQTSTNTASLTNFAGQEGGRDHTTNDITETADATTASATVAKTLLGTEIDNANNADNEAVVGELVNYEIVVDVPEGGLQNLRVIDDLDDGLAFVSSTITASGDLQFRDGGGNLQSTTDINNAATVTRNPADPASNASDDASRVIFDFGDTTNVNTNNAAAEQITITITAVVLNNTDVNAGNQLGNTAQVQSTNGTVDTDNTDQITILEPTVTITQSADTTTIDDGDPVTFTITVTNTGDGTGTGTDAHEVVITDTLPDGFTYAGNLTAASGSTAPTFSQNGQNLTFSYNTLAEGASQTFTFEATSNSSFGAGGETNTARLRYTSLPGDQFTASRSTHNANARERTGDNITTGRSQSPANNDYRDSADVSFTFPITPEKLITGTSETSTDDSSADTAADPRDLAIGEVVSFELRVDIGEGQLIDVVLRDSLSAGLTLIDGTAQFSIVADAAMTTPQFSGDPRTTPATLSSGQISTSGNQIDFRLGDIRNNDNDSGATGGTETLILRYDAVVQNTAGNQSVAGNADRRTNSFEFVESGISRADSNTVHMEIVEPNLAIDKQVISTNADGTEVTYEVTVINSGDADAFDVRIDDAMPTGLTLQPATLQITTSAGGTATGQNTTNTTANDLDVRFDSIADGTTVTIRYTATLAYNDAPVRNDVTTTYTSLPGDRGTSDATPGASGSSTGERNSGGGQNNYTDTDSAFVGSIGDRVFYDVDGNQSQQPNEPGLSGVTVELVFYGNDGVLGGGDDVIRTTTTDANGDYEFVGVGSGRYDVNIIAATLPSDIDNPTIDRDGIATANTAAVTLTDTPAGIVVDDADFGYRGNGSIGDTVFYDYNDDAAQNNGEPGIENVAVTLVWSGQDGVFGNADDLTLTQTTDATGGYDFGNLPSGTFRVSTAPSSVDFNRDGNADTVVLTTGNATQNVTLADNEDFNTADFGYRGTGQIGELIFFDHDGDGVLDGPDTGYEGVNVTLSMDFDNDGTADYTVSTTTDADGNYNFANLPPGTYTITVDQPDNTTGTLNPTDGTNAPTGQNARRSQITLGDGEDNDDQNFAYQGTGTIGDRVFLDRDGNNQYDPGTDLGIGGRNIRLDIDLDGDGNFDTFLTTTTATDGSYNFAGLPAGDYRVTVTDPIAGTTPTLDSDGVAAGSQHRSDVTLSTANPNSDAEDFAYVGTGSVGDLVYHELDGVAGFTAGDRGVYNAGVELQIDLDGDGTFEHSLTTTTDLSGAYQFDDLPAVDYRILITPPSDAVQTDDPDAANDNTHAFALTPGQDKDDADFGYRGASSVGDVVFWDRDNSGDYDPAIDEALQGVTVTLTADRDNDGNVDFTLTDVTDAAGVYGFENLLAGDYTITVDATTIPGASTGNSLEETPTFDSDGTATPHTTAVSLPAATTQTNHDFGYRGDYTVGDTVYWDANDNGVQDADEIGLSGVTVTLQINVDGDGFDASDVDYTFTTTTDSSGNYSFDNLPAGDYTVIVTPRDGTTIRNDPERTADNNAAADDRSSFTLSGSPATGSRDDLDFGYTGDGSIGDRVFFDYLGDGGDYTPSDGDRGLQGVTLTLTVTDAGQTYTTTTVTDQNGLYSFDDLISGTYTITVDNTNTTDVDTTDAGAPGIDSDDLPDQLGQNPTYDADGIGGVSANTTEVLLDASNPATRNNTTTNFGYHGAPDYAITIDDSRTTVTAGESVVYDINVANNGTSRGRNVVVSIDVPINRLDNPTVFDDAGNPVATTSTDNNGIRTLTWTVPLLQDGDDLDYELRGTVPSILDATNNNLAVTADVTDDAFFGIDPDTADNTNNDIDAVVDIQTLKNVTDVSRNTGNADLWDVTFEILIQNTGSVRLDNLTLSDDLTAQFGGTLVSVTTPTIDASGATTSDAPTINAAWANDTSLDLFDPADTTEYLTAGEFFTVTFVATIDPDADTSSESIENSATAGGTDVTTSGPDRTVNDLSDSGGSFTTTNAGAPGDNGTEDDPTPIYIADIGVAKQQTSFVQNTRTDGSGNVTRDYTVTYTLVVENIGTTTLDNLTLFDDVAAQFGDAFVRIETGSLSIDNTAGVGNFPVVNSAWETDTSLDMIVGNGRSLAAGSSFVVSFDVVVDPDANVNTPHTADNQATTTGRALDENNDVITNGGNPIVATDLSDSGTNVHTSNAGAPGDAGTSDDPTPLVLPELGVAKRLVTSTGISSGNRAIIYEVIIRNIGTVDLTNLTLVEDLDAQFGAGFIGIRTAPAIVAGPGTTAAALPTINANFDGDNDVDIFTAGTGDLRTGQQITLRFEIEADIDQLNSSSSNQVVAGGDYDVRPLVAGPDGTVTDLSDSGSDPAGNNPGQPGHGPNPPGDPFGFDNPTLVPAVGIALDHGTPVRDDDTRNFTVPVTIVVENLGATDLQDLVLIEDLIDIYGDRFVSADNVQIDNTGVTSTGSIPPTLNPNWTDDVTQNMLSGTTGLIRPGDSFTITFDMVIDPDATGQSSFVDNQATIQGSDPINPLAIVDDISDSGLSPSSTNTNEPGDNGTADDPTPLEIPDMAVNKRVTEAVQMGLTYELTIEFDVVNTGTVDLVDLNLTDDIADQFGVNFGGVVSGPRIVRSTAATDPTINPNYSSDVTESMFDGASGLIRPGQSITVSMVVEVVSVPGQTEATLTNQAEGTAGWRRVNGTASTLAAPINLISDLSDSGFNASSTNPGAPGDTGTFDDPTTQTLTFFTFDAYNDFSQNGNGLQQDGRRDASRPFDTDPFDNNTFDRNTPFNVFDVGDQYGQFDIYEDSRRRIGTSNRILTQQIQLLAPEPIFSGSARPGTQIVGRIYNGAGTLIGEELSMADVGGNWMMQFHDVRGLDHARIEFVEMPGTDASFDSRGDIYGYLGMDNADNDYAALEPWTSFDNAHQFTATHRPTVRQSLMHQHRVNTRPLAFGR